jgi:hypothetical protein
VGAPGRRSGREPAREPISTVHLGQFTRESANEIAGRLEAAEIVWWYKEPGWFSQIWEFGVRLFVDKRRLPEAERIVADVLAERGSGGAPDDLPPGP